MSGHYPWPPPRKRSTARNIERDWADSPYNYPPIESDVCACDSKYCLDCDPDGSGLGEPTVRRLVSKTKQNRVRLPTPMPEPGSGLQPDDWAYVKDVDIQFALWLTYYRLKRWILKRLGR
jgi:hypothetical protein